MSGAALITYDGSGVMRDKISYTDIIYYTAKESGEYRSVGIYAVIGKKRLYVGDLHLALTPDGRVDPEIEAVSIGKATALVLGNAVHIDSRLTEHDFWYKISRVVQDDHRCQIELKHSK